MDHERAFLQAIREAPHDDAPRLIYADWLEEQGGASRAARAAFIRIQCRLDDLPDDDPARDTLQDEATEILAEYEGEWTQPLHGIAGDWRFSRGFVERITIGAEKFLTNAERLFDFTPLRSMHFLIHARDVPHLAACEQLQGIQTLDFSGCHLNDRALQQLVTSPHLERLTALNLSGNAINTPGIRALVQSRLFARLRRLDLSRNIAIGDTATRLLAHESRADNLEALRLCRTNLTMSGLYDLFRSSRFPRLRHLHVSGVHPWGYPQVSPSDLPRNASLLTQLRSLDLSETRGTVIELYSILSLACRPVDLHALYLRDTGAESRDVEYLAQSSALANLTILDLSRNNLGAAGAQALARPPYLASLRELNVSHNNIRDKGAKAIADAPRLRQLRLLNLTGNGIGGPGLKALAVSANLVQIRALHLAGNFIGVDSVRALAESMHMQKLTCLDLSDAFLEEDSAHALASSANLSRLRTLLLKKNLLGDGGARALAQSPNLARLTTLDLNDNRIGKAGVEALAKATWQRMRSLDLRGNVFSDTQEALLRKRFGKAVQL